MYPGMMFNPIQPVSPFRMYPAQPFTIKIDITPNAQPQVEVQTQTPQQNQNAQQKEDPKRSDIYKYMLASVYDPKKPEVKEASPEKVAEKAVEKQAEAKQVENKKEETTLAQALAAQAGVQPPVNVQTKAAEVVAPTKSETKTEPKKVEKHKPEIVSAGQMKTAIDLNGLIAILTSPDYEEQADAMEAISEVSMYAPERAGELLDSKVVDTLQDIMKKDTSTLQGQEKELAERNKEYAMFTTATLQKLYADEVKAVGNVVVPTEDLIGMEGIVNELKTNPNASVREAAVASLGYVNKPEYKKDIDKLLTEASNDSDANVKAQADKQLTKSLNLCA